MRSITEQVMSSRRPGIIRSQRAAHLVRVRVRVRVRARARARARVRPAQLPRQVKASW